LERTEELATVVAAPLSSELDSPNDYKIPSGRMPRPKVLLTPSAL
jgi:hypothetical protein